MRLTAIENLKFSTRDGYLYIVLLGWSCTYLENHPLNQLLDCSTWHLSFLSFYFSSLNFYFYEIESKAAAKPELIEQLKILQNKWLKVFI